MECYMEEELLKAIAGQPPDIGVFWLFTRDALAQKSAADTSFPTETKR